MTRYINTFLLMLLLLTASSAEGFEYWNEVRYSAPLPGTQVTVRAENPSGTGVENYLLYAEDSVQETVMSPVADGPATLEATVPGPISDQRFYGFRLLQGTDLDFMPVRLPMGADPAPQDLTRVATDEEGDEVFGLPHLDLIDCRFSFDGNRLFATLQNSGGGFPVNQGFTFFSYLLGIANPAQADPDTVFALIHTINQPGIINPGLYRITGTGLSDLVQIGEIQVTEFPTENTLRLSCELADLLDDPIFTAWFDPTERAIGVAGFTQRITIFETVEADRSPGGTCYLREVAIDPIINQLPQLSDPLVPEPGPDAAAQVVYFDPDGHCPVLAEIVVDETESYPMFPVNLDYTAPITYRSAPDIPALVNGIWSHIVFSFSDNAVDVVSTEVVATPVSDEPLYDGVSLRLTGAPNPSSGTMAFRIDADRAGSLRLAVYDLAGRTVTVLADGHFSPGQYMFTWDGRDWQGRRQPTGVYFYRLQSHQGEIVRRITLVR